MRQPFAGNAREVKYRPIYPATAKTMSENKLNRAFVSEATRFLQDFDAKPEAWSPAREAEVKKYDRINELRDEAQAEKPASKIWAGF